MSAQAVTEKSHPFFQIYNTVIDHYRLNPYELALYTALVRHANRQTGLAFPGYSRLMELTRMARPTVSKYLKTLEQKKLIKIVRRWKTTKTGNRQRRVNHYYILDPHSVKTDEMNQVDPSGEPGVVHDPDNAGSPEKLPVVNAANRNETNLNQKNTNPIELNQRNSAQRAGRCSPPSTANKQSVSAPVSGAASTTLSGEEERWHIFCHRLADLCRLDFAANAGKLRKFASKLWRSGEGYSLADLDTFEQWWYNQDWRGKRGETPRLNDVCEGIRSAVFEGEFKESIMRASRYAYIEGELAAFIEH